MWSLYSLYFLDCLTRVLAWYQRQRERAIKWIRLTVGTEPELVYMLNQGDIVSSRYDIPTSLKTFVYNPTSHRMAPLLNVPVDARYRPVPFLSLSIKTTERTHCLDDWIGAIRVYNCPVLTIQQLVLLWSIANHVYVPKGATIECMNDEGEEVVAQV